MLKAPLDDNAREEERSQRGLEGNRTQARLRRGGGGRAGEGGWQRQDENRREGGRWRNRGKIFSPDRYTTSKQLVS